MTKRKLSDDALRQGAEGYRSGARVCWRYYRIEADAKLAAAAARRLGKRREAQGYDFGFCSPGSIRQVEPGSQYAGLWEVCWP